MKFRILSLILLCLLLVPLLSACNATGTPQESSSPESTESTEAPDVTEAPDTGSSSEAAPDGTDPEPDGTTGEDDPPVTPPEEEPADLIDEYGEVSATMSAVWSLKTHTDAQGVNCRIIQGGCTDGTYLYVAFNDGNSASNQSISAIRKYEISTGLLVATFENLKISHCNDMAYNPETNEIIMVHNAPDREVISIFDASSLTLKEKKTLTLKIYSMSYDPYERCYWVGISHGYTFAKLDLNFEQVGDIYEGYASGYTKQGMDLDSKYLYFLQYNKNCVMVYDKAGEFVQQIDLPKAGNEPENICHIGDTFYIGYLEGGGGTMYKTKLIEKGKEPVSATLEKVTEVPADAECKKGQGACTDGTYFYLAVNGGSAGSYRSVIYKVDPQTGKTVSVHEVHAGLTNDLVYDPVTDQILAVHNGNEPTKISVYAADTMQFVKTVTLDFGIYAMAYDEREGCYWVGKSGGYDFVRLDRNFKTVGSTVKGGSVGNTKQGIDCDGTHLYLVGSASNTLTVYEKNGTIVGTASLPTTVGDAQAVFHVGDAFYVFCSTSSGSGVLYRATLTVLGG